MKSKNNIKSTLIDTAGQTTAVINVPVPRSEQPKVAKPLMKSVKNIGQVCFIEKGINYPRLQMMGGELSVNGCAAAAFYWLRKRQLKSGTFETSGDGLRVEATIDAGTIKLKFPKQIVKSTGKSIICLAGINYTFIAGLTVQKILSLGLRKLLIKIAGQQPASGIIYFQKDGVVPLIYVKSTNTFVWETSCGSGSIAYSLYSGRRLIKQPSGKTLRVGFTKKFITYLTECKVLK